MTEPRGPREPREPASRDDLSVPFRTYIDTQLGEVRRIAEMAATIPTEVVPLKDHFEAVIANLKAYFQAILEEQRRAMILAEQEREKAAQVIREELSREIQAGDKNLREHIQMQVEQIRAALIAAELLEVERIHGLRQLLEQADQAAVTRVQAVHRETELVQHASAEAIAKAEAANEERFKSVNEFRAQLSDQTAQFIPREVAEAQFLELRRALRELADKVNTIA